ncbi:hypothetical protein [Lentzea aerocolonigenes]|uniref:hypothetical protein n=1 Tax=Lentzea aerocolonigenes TaxID=68170 RepID=UPI000B0345EC|nr:hypothetical protein [Lentzea aerocolonigenes]MCP2248929.1 hypothetical protein [Lentzea aerocolonigenes]
MKRVLGIATALLMLSASAVPATAAESGWASVEMTPVEGWKVLQTGYWYMRGGWPGTIDIDITNRSSHDVSDLYVRLSFPPDKLEVTGYEGDYWTCWDVVGHPGYEGLHCTTDGFLAVPDETFPTLKVHTKGREHHTDTLDVYAETTGEYSAHTGVPYRIDLST